MKKNDRFHIVIEDLGENGEGIGRADGYTLFVKGALIGDEIEGVCTKAQKSYGFGRLLRVVKPGPDRVEARCPVAGPCGGCQLQCMDYAAQLAFKERKVREHLVRIGGMSPEEADAVMEPIVGAEDPWRYRNKAQVPFARKDGRTVYGFYAGRTHSVIERDDCLIEQEGDAEILRAVRDFCDEAGVAAYDEERHEGLLRHVLIRSSRSGERLVCLVVNAGTRKAAERGFRHRLAELVGRLTGEPRTEEADAAGCGAGALCTTVTLNLNPNRTNVILGDETVVLAGSGYITERLDAGDRALEYRISTRSFFQVNPAQTEKLYGTAMEFAGLTGRETVWDLYCGTGSISLFAALRAGQVHGAEIIEDAVRDARENARMNGVENADFVCGRAEDILPAEAAKGWRADVIIVDPPRKGCAPELLDAACVMRPERIVYVSCNSATLARDIALLREKGYVPRRVRPVDMFPMTVGVETVVLLSKGNISSEKIREEFTSSH
ncbi:MAG: 23S rRNA (uracil(1939)-C(5))-methyltransferase RlmD [Lachnospiraceae bacterium]|nr:23S rRNA (uracil(1939)-C(5))-methyltransferase RlmD [Lachnospiraceae bacterium]